MSFRRDTARERRLYPERFPRPTVVCPGCKRAVFPVAITRTGQCFRCDARTAQVKRLAEQEGRVGQ